MINQEKESGCVLRRDEEITNFFESDKPRQELTVKHSKFSRGELVMSVKTHSTLTAAAAASVDGVVNKQ